MRSEFKSERNKHMGAKGISEVVGGTGSDRDRFYTEFVITIERLVGRKGYDEYLHDHLIGWASAWLAAREEKLMARYANGRQLAFVVARHRFEDARLWLERRAGKDVTGEVEGDEGELISLFDLAVAEDDQLADGVADSLLMDDIHAGIFQHFDELQARAFIAVELEGRPVGEVADELGTKHYNVSRWVKGTKEKLARLIVEYPEDFGLAA